MIRPKRCGRLPVRLRLRAPAATLVLLALGLMADGTGVLRWGLAAALWHETGHLLAWAVLVRRPMQLELSPAGFCLSMRGVVLTPWRERLLAAAGPAANFIGCIGTLVWMDAAGYRYAGCWFAAANLLLGVFHLLPLPGFDGARLWGR